MTKEALKALAEVHADLSSFATASVLAREVLRLLAQEEALHGVASVAVAEKEGAYTERDSLVCVLSKLWPSHLARHPEDDASWEDEWRWIVCVHSPVGQLTWHIRDSERGWFDHLTVGEGHWDGHTTEQKYARLATLKAQEEARGEVVEACPRCSAHEPTWLPDAGCWRCENCSMHLDTVEHWQDLLAKEDVTR